MRKRGAAVALTSVVLAVVGCGGGSEKKSAEAKNGAKTVSAWISQFSKAAKAGDCKRLKALAPYLGCSIKTAVRGAHVAGSERHGSGAVVDFAGVHYPKQTSDTAQVVLVEKSDGTWIGVQDLPESPREVGTKPPTSLNAFSATGARWIDAVASGDCKTAYKLGVSGDPSLAAYCKNIVAAKSKTQQHQVLAANPTIATEPLGGTANIQFFRIAVQVPKSIDPKARTSFATLPVIHVSKALAKGASNPYLVAQPIPAPTPASVRAAGGEYTKAVTATYVKNCSADGESSAQCGCEIEMIAAAVPYPDFKTPTGRFEKALPGIKRACRIANGRSGSADEKKVAQVALGGDLVPGYICSPKVSTDKVIAKVGGTRFACGKDLGSAPPDNTIKVTDVSVNGTRATAKGTDKQGHFTVSLVRQGARWLVDGFANSG